MSENLENTKELRKYLLGQITDDNTLIFIEERLLTDRKFFNELEMAEDDLIEDYAGNLLVGEDFDGFKRLFLNVPARREKINFTRALHQLAREENFKKNKEKKGFFGGWIFSPQFAFGLLFLGVAVGGLLSLWFVFRQNEADKSLADLRALNKNQRPVEARIVGSEYAPFVVLRGTEKEDKNQLQKRKVELDLSAAIVKNPNAAAYNALGIYYLTEKHFDEAAAQFADGIELQPQNAEFHSNLGAALYEKAKSESPGEKLNTLNKSLAEASKAVELNPDLTDAIFNKGLVLQELNLPEEAAIVWKQYLEKDATSKWSDEARKNLQELQRN